MKIPFLKKFLFCISLELGSKIIGFFIVTLQLLLSISMYTIFFRELATGSGLLKYIGAILIRVLSLGFMDAFFAVILLRGVLKRKPTYIKVWLLIQLATLVQKGLSLSMLMLLEIIDSFTEERLFPAKTWKLLLLPIFIILDVYSTLVVYSYYRDEYYRDRRGNLIENDDIISTLDLSTIPL